jgi:uncharacterized protein (TIGR02284 family)
MSSSHGHDPTVKALNDLIATCRDAEEGYAKAAKGVHNTHLSNRLVDLSAKRGQQADELRLTVERLGQEASTEAHFGGILHKGWVDLETRIRPKSEIEIVRECIAGDDGTRKHYQHALSLDLPADVRTIVETQLRTIEADIGALEGFTEKGKVQHA